MKAINIKYFTLTFLLPLLLFLFSCEKEKKLTNVSRETLCNFHKPISYENNIKPVNLVIDIKDTTIYLENEIIYLHNIQGIIYDKINDIYPQYFCKYFLSVMIFYDNRNSFETIGKIDQIIKIKYLNFRNIACIEIFNKKYLDLNDNEKYKIDTAIYYEVSIYEDILKDKGIMRYIS